jgi:hypothetical protein
LAPAVRCAGPWPHFSAAAPAAPRSPETRASAESKVTPHDGRYDTPLGPNLRHTGLALNLVVFKLIGVIGPTLIAALVAGDIVAGEDMGGTLKTILVRSLRRGEVLAGKALALLTYLVAALALFALAGVLAGVIAWGFHPLVNLSGHEISALHALGLTLVAMVLYAVPVLAGRASGCSCRWSPATASRRSRERCSTRLRFRACRRCRRSLRLTPSCWSTSSRPGTTSSRRRPPAIVRSLWVSAAFALAPLMAAWAVFTRRDVTS